MVLDDEEMGDLDYFPRVMARAEWMDVLEFVVSYSYYYYYYYYYYYRRMMGVIGRLVRFSGLHHLDFVPCLRGNTIGRMKR